MGNVYPAFGQIGGIQMILLKSPVSQLLSAQNNLFAKVTYCVVAHSDFHQNSWSLLKEGI